ncbi:MAG: hypothetical protein JRG74_12490 [Deltaproteobacteria bacterium]|nr:hypothetical protein [Deltaproteobacteria bacterium]
MAWVNGRGYQRACSYRHNAAVAEMSVAFCFIKARQAGCVLFVPVFDQPNRRIRTRMSGAVGGALSDNVPIPIYISILSLSHEVH